MQNKHRLTWEKMGNLFTLISLKMRKYLRIKLNVILCVFKLNNK